MKVTFQPVHSNLKIQAIKALREATGLGLKEAKDAVEVGRVEIDPDRLPLVQEAMRPFGAVHYVNPNVAGRDRLRLVASRLLDRACFKLAVLLESLETRFTEANR